MQEFRSKLPIYAYTDSTIGGRPENQDDMAMLDTPHGCLAIVCDGMGGGPGGRTASYVAKMAIVNTILNTPVGIDRDRLLRQALANAQTALENKVRENPKLEGMGSTAVVALIDKRSAVVAHVGDSRFYKIRGEHQLFHTNDHSLVSEMMAKKKLTEEQARTSSNSNIITRGLGGLNNNTPDIDTITFRDGDRFVLCTDGIWGVMPAKALIDRFKAPMPLPQAVEKLQAEVDRIGKDKGGHHDNHTIIIMELGFNSLMQEPLSTKMKAIIGAGAAVLAVSILLNIALIGRSSKSTTPEDNGSTPSVIQQDITEDPKQEANNTGDDVVAKQINIIDSLRNIILKQSQIIDSLKRPAPTPPPAATPAAPVKPTAPAKPTPQAAKPTPKPAPKPAPKPTPKQPASSTKKQAANAGVSKPK